MPEPLPMDRFRPNMVIDDSVEPWAEDDWQALSIVGPPDRKVEFLSVKPCSRCKVQRVAKSHNSGSSSERVPLLLSKNLGVPSSTSPFLPPPRYHSKMLVRLGNEGDSG